MLRCNTDCYSVPLVDSLHLEHSSKNVCKASIGCDSHLLPACLLSCCCTPALPGAVCCRPGPATQPVQGRITLWQLQQALPSGALLQQEPGGAPGAYSGTGERPDCTALRAVPGLSLSSCSCTHGRAQAPARTRMCTRWDPGSAVHACTAA